MLKQMEFALLIAFVAGLGCGVLTWKLLRARRTLVRTSELLFRVQNELKEFRSMVDHEVMILRTDLEGNVTRASQAFAEFMGYEEQEMVGKPFRQILHPEALPECYRDLWSTLAVTFGWRDEISGQKQSGKQFAAEINVLPVRDSAGNLEGYHAVVHDISSKKQLEILSITDELTGLFNRRHFNHCFVRELVRSRRSKEFATFAMIDVDHFKLYNDRYGHQSGDDVLQALGALFREILRRPTDFAFRLGGEEFGILLINMPPEKSRLFLENIRQAVIDLAIVHEDNHNVGKVSISMGAVFVSDPDPDQETRYFRAADSNLYEAKEGGRNRLVFTEFT